MDELNTLITEFLKERRESDYGGWPPVTDADMQQLYAILNKLIELKWEADPDGDRPIDYIIVNRKTHEHIYWWPVEYYNKQKTLADKLRVLEGHIANMSSAAKMAEIYGRLIRYEIEEAEKKDELNNPD